MLQWSIFGGMEKKEVTIVVNGREFKEVAYAVCEVMYLEGEKPEWLNLMKHTERPAMIYWDSNIKNVYVSSFKALRYNDKFYAPKEFENR